MYKKIDTKAGTKAVTKTETKVIPVDYGRIASIINNAVKESMKSSQITMLSILAELGLLNELVIGIASAVGTPDSNSEGDIPLEDWKDATTLLKSIDKNVNFIKGLL